MTDLTTEREALIADYLRKPFARVLIPEDDRTFAATIPAFPGCIATGRTEVEAITALRRIAESWLLSEIVRGHSLPSCGDADFRVSGPLTEEMVEQAARVLALEDAREWDKPAIREIYRERYEALARAVLTAALGRPK